MCERRAGVASAVVGPLVACAPSCPPAADAAKPRCPALEGMLALLCFAAAGRPCRCMGALGVSTTRALTLIKSQTETTNRPWSEEGLGVGGIPVGGRGW